MLLPGFTAEKALQKKSKMYMGLAIATASERLGVVPQFWRCVGDTCCSPWSGQCFRCSPWGYCWPVGRPTILR
jgi:hypothetical protein